MKIKTKLKIIIIVNIMILVSTVSLNLLWQIQADKQLKQQGLIMELNQAIFERARLREEYFLYREDRSKEQFLLMQKKIAGLLERMLGVFTEPEEKIYLSHMIGFHKDIDELFNHLTRVDQKAAFHSAVTQALRERIISQMLVNAHSMHRDGLKLLKTASEKIKYQDDRVRLYSNIVFGLLALFIVSFAWIMIRNITGPLKSLQEGAEMIAGGNLDYKTNIRTSDEMGQLSNAFDSMTENLKNITVTRDELNQEIEIRKRTEQALRESENNYRELSIIDGLTQLYNPRHFHHQIKMEIERADRYGQPLTLLLLDLDDFKTFNDAYGHIEGDQVLLRLGQVVKRSLRQTDSAYRYGGEEFTVILPMTTSVEGAVTAQRIRTEFKKEAFSPTPNQDVHVTVSIGLGQHKTHEDMKVFVHRVDQLMYQGKKNGKDRVCCGS
jgi:diguanylate cyclase (GGDEF)-like protein